MSNSKSNDLRIENSKRTWTIQVDEKKYTWSSPMERVKLIRKKIPYSSIESVSERLNSSVKTVLKLLDMPQTTYNKKKIDNALLDTHLSEHILILIELVDYGIEVFNQEAHKFQNWLRKPNIALGGLEPQSLLDSTTGIDEVRNCLNRIEYGNFA